jgi:hypothetical protein
MSAGSPATMRKIHPAADETGRSDAWRDSRTNALRSRHGETGANPMLTFVQAQSKPESATTDKGLRPRFAEGPAAMSPFHRWV